MFRNLMIDGFLCGLEVLRLGNRVQHQLGLDVVRSLGLHHLAHLILGLAGIAHEVFRADALVGQAHTPVAVGILQFILDHGVGDIAIRLIHSLLHQIILKGHIRVAVTQLGQFLDDAVLILSERGIGGDIRRELIIKLRLYALGDAVELHMEHSRPARQFLSVILGRECDVQVFFLAGLHTDHLLLKPGNKGVAAKLQALVFRLAAFKGDAVHSAQVVNLHDIACRGRAAGHFLLGGGLLHIMGDAVLDLFLADVMHVLDGLEALVIAQRYIRQNKDFSGKLQFLPAADLLDIQLRPVHGMEVALGNGFLIGIREHRVQRFVIKHTFTIHALNELARGLALTEAGHIKAPSRLQISLLHRRVKICRRYGERDFYLISGKLFSAELHGNLLCCCAINLCSA
ncbi:hypothetical protein SDC9_128509 [bioreactor metagenome]|uniref:NAD-specific glutamate dehydrogenase n=1 Tax=bioreactor metagenome TaxID=1076179 RepID=A0A645CWE9_9ZZZZ